MTDMFSAEERSAVMRAVRSQDTSPELAVRSLLRELGVRYRLHRADLPGKPDIVLASRRKVIFVHGCFWHRHRCPRGNRTPHSRREYWVAKLERNRLRDRRRQAALRRQGWSVAVVWECQLKDRPRLKRRLQRFLDQPAAK